MVIKKRDEKCDKIGNLFYINSQTQNQRTRVNEWMNKHDMIRRLQHQNRDQKPIERDSDGIYTFDNGYLWLFDIIFIFIYYNLSYLFMYFVLIKNRSGCVEKWSLSLFSHSKSCFNLFRKKSKQNEMRNLFLMTFWVSRLWMSLSWIEQLFHLFHHPEKST